MRSLEVRRSTSTVVETPRARLLPLLSEKPNARLATQNFAMGVKKPTCSGISASRSAALPTAAICPGVTVRGGAPVLGVRRSPSLPPPCVGVIVTAAMVPSSRRTPIGFPLENPTIRAAGIVTLWPP